jgi:predicted nucleotidyltransferase
MIFNEYQIKSKAWLILEVVNLILHPVEVSKIFLIGSYASGKQTEYSDLDFLVELIQPVEWYKPRQWYPEKTKIDEITKKLDNKRIHVIFGSEQVAKSLHDKYKGKTKDYSYRQILGGLNAITRSTSIAS